MPETGDQSPMTDQPQPGAPKAPANTAENLYEHLRLTRSAIVQLLVDKRAARDALNAEIRQLVADAEMVAQALRPFDKARERKAQQ